MSYPCCDPRLRPPPAQLTEAQMSALSLLLGCPDGATEFALVVHGGVKPEILYDLVSDGLAHAATTYVAARSDARKPLAVKRLRISAAGKRVLTVG